MLLTHFYALALAGALFTGAWLFLPEERLQITTLSALLSWFLLALLGGQTKIASSGELITAPMPTEFRFFAAFLGLLSGLALILGIWGVYPPQETTNE
jgi:hypothetical protein